MNEKIKELAIKAQNNGDSIHYYDPVFAEKFAELIVAECVEVFSKDLPDPTSLDYQLGSLPEVVNRVANVVEHFGVEQ